MNWVERWFLKRTAKKLAKQGAWHDIRITQYYKVMVEAACLEFSEDNPPTQRQFLTECHDNAINAVLKANRL